MTGVCAAEELRAGDEVITRDNAFQPILWVGRLELDLKSLVQHPTLAPITISSGSMGDDTPTDDLVIAPDQHLLNTGALPRLYFDEAEVLLPACQLLDVPGVSQSVPNSASYVLIAFNRRELILCNGLWVDSFQPTDPVLRHLDAKAKADLKRLYRQK